MSGLGSHLLQMRGLKLFVSWNAYLCGMVASFTDAWIETTFTIKRYAFTVSHLLQMRGLKLVSLALLELVDAVASFTDAWIETLR